MNDAPSASRAARLVETLERYAMYGIALDTPSGASLIASLKQELIRLTLPEGVTNGSR